MEQRKIVYKGHCISLASLPEQGRWAYRIDEQPIRMLESVRPPMQQAALESEALSKARAEIDRAESRDQAVLERQLTSVPVSRSTPLP